MNLIVFLLIDWIEKEYYKRAISHAIWLLFVWTEK